MRNITILTLLLTLILLMNCEDNFPDELPPITTTGENAFGALMNGEVYVPNGNALTLAVDFDFPEPPINELRIRTLRSSNESKTNEAQLVIHQQGINEIGIYNVTSAIAQYQLVSYANSERYDTLYDACGELTGTLEIIHLDSVDRVISGTFELKLIESNSPNMKCLSITEGRFDLQK